MTLVRDESRRVAPGQADVGGERIDHDADAFAWALQQAAFLRAGRFELIDADAIADELAGVAHDLSDKLQSDLVRILQHLLKWDHQHARRSRTWMLSVREHRRRVGNHLRKAPGLASALPAIVEDAYQSARNAVLVETGLGEAALSTTCPYAWNEIMTRPIDWPQDP